MAKGSFEPTDLQAGPPPVDDEPVARGRSPAWARRRRSLFGAWHTYRRSPMGMAGLVIMIVFALSGFLLSVAYTAPPLRLKKHGLGEATVLVVWGPLMVGGALALKVVDPACVVERVEKALKRGGRFSDAH